MLRNGAVLFILLLFASCKKDLLHFSNVQQLDSHTTADRLDRIIFINDSVGFVSGGQRFTNACILKTTDAGHTWEYNTYPAAGKELFTIASSPNGKLYSCGFDGKLLVSPDTGSTWQFSQLRYIPYNDLAFSDALHAVMVGGTSFNSGLRSMLDPTTNATTYDSLPYQLNRVKFVNPQTGFTCGYGAVLKTTDAGNTWNFLQIKGDDFTGMDIHNGTELWVCGYNGCVFHSSDAGNSWEELRNGNDLTLISYHLQDIVFKDSQNGWAVGENGVVIHSVDGGHNWAQYDPFTGNGLKSIAICPNGDLVVGGYNGALYRLSVQ